MIKFFKSFFLISTILFLFFSFTNYTKAELKKEPEYKTFIVTAYYSPLANQKKYITWSFYWDKKLNWEWHTTASWKPVKIWTLAAPKNYPYWTKIYFKNFWIATVEDRWWAIVKAWVKWHEHDRIDIWMWYWDKWLQRALKWWKREIKWKIVWSDNKVNIQFSDNWLLNEKYKTENIKKLPKEIATIFKYWAIKVNQDKPDEKEVKKLQKLFKKLNLYKWKISWKYKDIENDLIAFQMKIWVIRKRTDWGAGHFWEKTKSAMITYFEWKTKAEIEKNIIKQKKLNKKNKKYITYNLKQEEIRKLKNFSNKIHKFISKKSKWNKKIEKKIKINLKKKIVNIHSKTKNKILKIKLNYLLNNI